MRPHCKYDPFMYKGQKYLVDWFPTKSTVRGHPIQEGSEKPDSVTAQTKHVVWLPTQPFNKTNTMKKWDYDMIFLDATDKPKAHKRLNEVGAQGWELTTMMGDWGVLKREVTNA